MEYLCSCLQGWNNVFYMLITADVLAAILLIRQVVFEIEKFCCPRTIVLSQLPYVESGIHSDHPGRESEQEPLLQN